MTVLSILISQLSAYLSHIPTHQTLYPVSFFKIPQDIFVLPKHSWVVWLSTGAWLTPLGQTFRENCVSISQQETVVNSSMAMSETARPSPLSMLGICLLGLARVLYMHLNCCCFLCAADLLWPEDSFLVITYHLWLFILSSPFAISPELSGWGAV